ncbi:MetQ/NlpA family ABC transporter substrate-binding protein [Enterococcus sp. 669A]|uniref:Lipoprotein n=1 Tax=Candidatus Enterococcus moelleringii TaxID=2815325 RepID=A0ABS3LEE3_9ENTE|nr:MetQ/NlpA family ABC transporter substrate-binding protein [Enterococcus sp. 669A]MBO1307455.1 MetQ/NlpA family ABC transporter substrate-binding protein [Enterococcus sp. 669A]
MKKHGKQALLLGTIAAVTLLFAGCGNNAQSETLDTESVTVGVTSGPHQEILEEVAKQAEADGLTINIKNFDDYNTPNTALNDGDLDANSYQTIPFLDQQVEDKGYEIEQVFETVAFPLGAYSEQIKDLDELKSGDKVGVPNDPTNEYRALKLLEEAGVITLKDGVAVQATKNDVEDNPKDIEIVELEASQIPSQLGELTAAVINTNFAFSAGLTINDDSIFHEPLVDNPYPNVFVVRSSNKDDEVVKEIEKYYHSDETKKFIEEKYKGSVVPAF